MLQALAATSPLPRTYDSIERFQNLASEPFSRDFQYPSQADSIKSLSCHSPSQTLLIQASYPTSINYPHPKSSVGSLPEANGSVSGQHYALYLVGQNITHTIAPPMHDLIASTLLHLPGTWSFTPVECPSVESAVSLLRGPAFAGGVVTMPYKKTIMKYLDELDDLCVRIGACNGVYLAPQRKLRGTNTAWRGIKGCLLSAQEPSEPSNESDPGRGKPALVVGAGGASRAAVYALGVEMGVSRIYVINCYEGEVGELVRDVGRMMPAAAGSAGLGHGGGDSGGRLEIVHVRSVEQARALERPYFVVGRVPDFEPQTREEREARDVLELFFAAGGLGRGGSGHGVCLDMCFKPRGDEADPTGWEGWVENCRGGRRSSGIRLRSSGGCGPGRC